MLKFLIFTQFMIFLSNIASHSNYERESNGLLRLKRQAKPKQDPYQIAKRKCTEYTEARYREITIYAQTPGEKPRIQRKLDCVKSQPLIFGGTPAILKEFPHMAAIGYSNKDEIKDAEWGCGGSLISDKYVLTAAHCLNAKYGSTARWVRLGELVIDDTTDLAKPKDFGIAEFTQHPRYKHEAVYHDIALIRLSEAVKFSPHMRPICLYPSSTLTPDFHGNSLITGWGKTDAASSSSDALLKAKISFAGDSECAAAYKNDKKLPKGYHAPTMICAGDKIHGKDTCQGDSGGPLQGPVTNIPCMFWQVGVTSYGNFICGNKTKPSIYTKVYPYIPWIQSIVWP